MYPITLTKPAPFGSSNRFSSVASVFTVLVVVNRLPNKGAPVTLVVIFLPFCFPYVVAVDVSIPCTTTDTLA